MIRKRSSPIRKRSSPSVMLENIEKIVKSKKSIKTLLSIAKLVQDIKNNHLNNMNLDDLNKLLSELRKFKINKIMESLSINIVYRLIDENINTKLKFEPEYKYPPTNKEIFPCIKDGYKLLKELDRSFDTITGLVEKDGNKYIGKMIKIRQFNPHEHIETIKNMISIYEELKGQNIVPEIYDYYLCTDNNGSSVYITMEYFNAGKFTDFLKISNNKLTSKLKNKIDKKINILHKNNIIHNDLSYDNILLHRNIKGELEPFIMLSDITDTFNSMVKKDKLLPKEDNYNINELKVKIISLLLIKHKILK